MVQAVPKLLRILQFVGRKSPCDPFGEVGQRQGQKGPTFIILIQIPLVYCEISGVVLISHLWTGAAHELRGFEELSKTTVRPSGAPGRRYLAPDRGGPEQQRRRVLRQPVAHAFAHG